MKFLMWRVHRWKGLSKENNLKKSFCPIIFLKEFMANTILILNFTKKVNFLKILTPKPN